MVAELAAELEVLEDAFDDDHAAALASAEAIERAAEGLGDHELVMRARLMQSDLWLRAGGRAMAARTQWEINGWAAEHGHRQLLARSHFLLASCYWSLGDLAAFLDHAVSAVELLDETATPRRRALYLTKLADALKETGSIGAARERYAQAERLAAATGDGHLQLIVLNNLAYSEYMAGEPERGRVVVEQMRAVSAASGCPLSSVILDTIARIQIALGEYAEAERTVRAGIEEYRLHGYEGTSSLVMCLITLAVAQRHRGATDEAQAALDRSRALCNESGSMFDVELLGEQAELYAAKGDHARAFETYKEFHAAEKEMMSRQREAQARTRQVMFETAEARQEAERFREQARRDPLTGLRNRRYVDEHLPALIDEAVQGGTSLLIALVDLDHFKRINDTCSHEVGDQVLVAVAEMLAAAIPSGFAARLGGEEFLLVLTATGPVEAVQRLDRLRRVVAAHQWRPLTADLPVTVSIGVTVVQSGSTQAGLLARADEYLYTAKREGRNRVCVDPEIALTKRRQYRDRRPALES